MTTIPTAQARTIAHLTAEHHAWPYGTGEDAPREAWAIGNIDLLAQANRAVALVGSRACTAYGQTIAHEFAQGIVQAGRPVITDLGFGIAAAATRGALVAAEEATPWLRGILPAADRVIPAHVIVQAPANVERIHPHIHAQLADDVIRAGGVLVSTTPPGGIVTLARVRENAEIIGRMAAATVVIEAGERSGSRLTIEAAYQADRPTYAVPGPLTSVASRGCHDFIRRNRATIATGTADVLGVLEVIDLLH